MSRESGPKGQPEEPARDDPHGRGERGGRTRRSSACRGRTGDGPRDRREPERARAVGRAARPAKRARRQRPSIDAGVLSGLGARNIGSATMSGRISAVAARNEDGQDDRVRRRGERRRVDARSTAARRSSRSSTRARAVDRRDRHRPDATRARSGSAPARPGRATPSRSATASTSRPTTARRGRTWASPSPSASRGSSSTRRTATSSTPACPASCGATAPSAASTRRPTAARPGASCSKGANLSTGCSGLAMDPNEPRRALRGDVGLPPQGLDVPLGRRRARRAERERAPAHRATAARPGRRSPPRRTRACRRGRGAASRSRSRRRIRRSSTRSSSRPTPRSTAPTTAARTWEARDKSQGVVWRPFYFARLVVDPKNADRVFKPGLDLVASEDGGRSFSSSGGGSHGDWHDLWIDPDNTQARDRRRRRRASGCRGTAAAAGGRRTTCRSRSSTT